MNYSQTLPKRTYTTTIGNFSLVDFCSYFEISQSNVETTPIKIDKSQTLVEKAYSVYGDVNSFWLFLLANNTINPFKLAKQSKSTLIEDIENTTTVHGSIGAVDMYSPAGSILVPYSATGGSAWQYSYVGNFSLTGGFVLTKAYNTFSKRSYLNEPEGLTISNLTSVTPVVKGTTNYYQTDLGLYSGIQLATVDTQDNVTKDLKYSSAADKQAYLLLDSELPILKKGMSPPYEPTGVTQAEQTFTDFAESQSITIEAYVPYSVGYKAFNLVKQKYVV